ncbi:MAG TPA: peptidyl-prolyl cis-trans isomerase [Polyangia bacterium]|nr:peptidyl-prolyl cis-trans isomerase [Polyangia bacterium]
MRNAPSRLVSVCLLLVGGFSACSKTSSSSSSGSGNVDMSQAVARVDDTVITVAELQERINKQSPFIRARYTSNDKKKEYLDNLIRFEVMAKEAKKRGYDQDPEVVRVMKQQMISKFLQKDFESKLKVEDVPEADVEKYYNSHPDEFNQKDQVRVSQILVKDKAKADKVEAELKALPKTPAGMDQKPFRDLVAKYSEDADSKARGGDLLFLDKDSPQFPKPVIEAAFALKEVGDVSPPVKTDKGYHILKLMQKRPGFNRPMAEVKRQIQQRLFRDIRTKALDDFYADMRKKANVEVIDANLGKVVVDTTGAEGAGGGMPGMPGNPHGAMPGMPGMPRPMITPATPAPAPKKP